MKLLIGCPIYKREWILQYWVRCIKNQHIEHDSVGFLFEVSSEDESTIAILESWKKHDLSAAHFELIIKDDVPHYRHENNSRQWTISKYENMVRLRNSLLERVREISPDYFFSLDSDILIENPNTLELLVTHIRDGADAVSPLMFMTPAGDQYPSVMTWLNDGSNSAMRLPRYPVGEYFQSDVIMAAKMMSRKIYENIDYSIHHQGEDVGWSWACKEAGYKLFSASYIYAPHIMSPDHLSNYLQNGDSRHRSYSIDSKVMSI